MLANNSRAGDVSAGASALIPTVPSAKPSMSCHSSVDFISFNMTDPFQTSAAGLDGGTLKQPIC